jgi:transcriptional regulator
MYLPKYFNITDSDKIFEFIRANAFGQLISLVDGKPFCSHIPFLLGKDERSLVCHMAKRNRQWENIEGQDVLVTFLGPHDYISPSWYDTPGVPTRNYQAVHVYGRPQLITDQEKLGTIINQLTGVYEAASDQPWKPVYKKSMLAAIVGIEIEIADIQCKYKLGQNDSRENQLQIIEALKKTGSTQLSQAMTDEL